MFGLKLTSYMSQCYVTMCSSLFSSITMASIIALNSLLVSSLQEDEEMKLSFEKTSWISKFWRHLKFIKNLEFAMRI